MQARSNTYQGFAFFMAFWMLLTSCGLIVDAHYCKKELQRISFLGKAKSCQEILEAKTGCCMRKKTTSCLQKAVKLADHEAHSGKGCCKNSKHVVLLDVDSPFHVPPYFTILGVKKILIAIPFIASYFKSVPLTNIFNFASYWPPPIIKDIPIAYQVFLC